MFVEELSALAEAADYDDDDNDDNYKDADSNRPLHPRSATYTNLFREMEGI